MAQVVAQRIASQHGLGERKDAGAVMFDSAGTHAHHLGERMDPRAASALTSRGYALGKGRSRRVSEQDFEEFDLILAMDSLNLAALRDICPAQHSRKLCLLLDYAEGMTGQDVPDPYYGNALGFERVLDLCELGAAGLIKTLRQVAR